MKIEAGMYVRLKKGKVIYVRKLLEVIHHFETFDVYRTDKEYFDFEEKDYFDIVYPNDILKASDNIIDLIEIGDYVNGWKVTTINKKSNKLYSEDEADYLIKTISKKNIKDTVTKEQFDKEKYVIGE